MNERDMQQPDDRDPFAAMTANERAEYEAWSESLMATFNEVEACPESLMATFNEVEACPESLMATFNEVEACPTCRAKYLRDCKCQLNNGPDHYSATWGQL